RRSPTQRVAHLKPEFATDGAVSHAIDNGVFVQGYHKVRRLDDDARCCAKCQECGGHLARDCTSSVDVRGRSAEHRRTAGCTATGAGTFKCANCKVGGHGAVDRPCAAFHCEQQKKQAKDPTAGCRYVPTNDPRTWVDGGARGDAAGPGGSGSRARVAKRGGDEPMVEGRPYAVDNRRVDYTTG
ncbi:hypothetical protein DFH07DRAFT_730742, partial [Mycena maculata]